VEYTEKVNSRNFSRAVNKRYAWNYTPEHNRVEQVGSAEWIRDLIDRNLLYDVVTEPVRKLNFGCGGNRLEGWENFDIDVDISKPLPFPDECARFILAEHCVEHVSHQDAWMFFKECHRILQPGGVLRVAIPDVCRMERSMTPEYSKAVRDGGHGSNPIRAAVFEHGHRAAWDQALLGTFLCAIGFKATAVKVGESEHGELRGVEGHWKVVGESIARVETSVVEGTKA
jgi:predicted SAM-dependent methyltransferase